MAIIILEWHDGDKIVSGFLADSCGEEIVFSSTTGALIWAHKNIQLFDQDSIIKESIRAAVGEKASSYYMHACMPLRSLYFINGALFDSDNQQEISLDVSGADYNAWLSEEFR